MAFVDNVQELVEDPSLERYIIEEGDRLFQIVAPGLEGITVELVDSLPETKRNTGGIQLLTRNP